MKELPDGMKREFEIGFWYGYPQAKRPSTKGFPKTEKGELGKSYGAAGALRLVSSGWCSKVQLKHRPTGRIVWTAVPEKVPGLNVRMARLIKGDYHPETK